MNRSILVGLLALQILIVSGVLAWNLREPDKPDQFFDFDPSLVTKMQIRTEEHDILVEKSGEDWQLADGKPADGDKVDRTLDKLADASTGWPVATSSSTAERFEVTEDSFQKHLTLFSEDDVVADAFFGTSPSFRLVHVSAADGGPVFAIEFSNYELGNDASSWLDKNLLRPVGDLMMLKHEGQYTLNKVEDEWVEAGETELDSDTVDKVIGRFENLNVYTINDSELPEEPTAQLSWTDSEGETSLSLYHLEEEDDWVGVSDRVAGQYGISTYIAKDMAMTLEELMPQVEEESTEEVGSVERDDVIE